jgi:zona occludens toxin
MAITAYTGLQGHGKTYEVVKNVILTNILKGRRVVTNIAGLKDELIREYLIRNYSADPVRLGQIVHVSNEDVLLPYFFPWEGYADGLPLKVRPRKRSRFSLDDSDVEYEWPEGVAPHPVVKPGDVAVLDEVWRWYATGERILPEHMKFFRMHRHFVDPETGVTCDAVLIIQVLQDLQDKVLKVVEKNFHMQKHKGLGFENRYVVNCFGGYRQTQKALIESHQEQYEPDIYNLYSSYSQNKSDKLPSEQNADARGKLWNRWHFKLGIPLAVVSIISSFFYMWRFFHPKPKEPANAVAGAHVSPVPAAPAVSPVWRIVGVFHGGGALTFVLQDAQDRVRFLVDPPGYKVVGSEYELKLPEGDFVASWSGAAPSVLPGRGFK